MIPRADWNEAGRARWREEMVGRWYFGENQHLMTAADFDLLWMIETRQPGHERYL